MGRLLVQVQPILQYYYLFVYMHSEHEAGQGCSFLKLLMASTLFLVAILLPHHKITQHMQAATDMTQFCEKIKAGPNIDQMEIPYSEFLRVLSLNPYSGIWQSSIKQSRLLRQQNGTIQLTARLKTAGKPAEGYWVNIKIFDGLYQDSGNYEIEMDSASIHTQQQFVQNHLIFQTLSPMIGLSQHQKILRSQKQKPIYINKLKFRLNLNETLRIQLLLAAEYEINVITQDLEHDWHFFHEFMFASFLTLQVVLQSIGAYRLLREVEEQDMIAKSISPTFLKLCMAYDTIELTGLAYLILGHGMYLLAFPACLLLIFIVYLEDELYGTVMEVIAWVEEEEHELQLQRQGGHGLTELPQNDGISDGSPRIAELLRFINKNQMYLLFILSLLISYLNNMSNYIYLVYFFILLLPQITRNCRQGNKINYQFQAVIAYAYPRLLPLLYIRFFGLKSLFLFEPGYVFCLVLVLLSVASSAMLFAQKKYGSRSILPKFLFPQGFKAKFKFFMIQDQNTTCRVCCTELSSLPNEIKQKSKLKEQIFQNKIILTPCHHKFHAFCLQKWMRNKIQCPSCSHDLPPVDNQ